MKRIIAVLLALMMLMGMTAFAEEQAGPTAAVLQLYDVNVTMGDQSVDIEDLAAVLALDASSDAETRIALNVASSEEVLSMVIAKLAEGKIKLAMSGSDYTYVEQIPEIPNVPVEQLPSLFAALVPALDAAVLPPVPAISIPKADLSGLLSGFATSQTAGGYEFEIPHEQIIGFARQLVQLAGYLGLPEQVTSQLPQISSALDSIDQSGVKISLAGSLEDDGASQVVTAGLYLSAAGDSPMGVLTFESAENNVGIGLDVAMDPSADPARVAEVAITSDPAARTMDFVLNAGVANIALSIYPEAEMQKISLTGEAGDEQAYLEFGYGKQDGDDLVTIAVVAGGAVIAFAVDTVMGDDGTRVGTVGLNVGMGEQSVNVTGNLTMYLDDALDLSGYEMPAEERSFSELDQSELQATFTPVMEYLNTLEPAA